MEADGLSAYGVGRSGTGADGSHLRMDLLGRLRVTEPDGTRRTLSLEVPYFPPPFPACWMIAACGMLMTVWLVLTAVRVEEYRGKRPLPQA